MAQILQKRSASELLCKRQSIQSKYNIKTWTVINNYIHCCNFSKIFWFIKVDKSCNIPFQRDDSMSYISISLTCLICIYESMDLILMICNLYICFSHPRGVT